tara:strand:- start:144 stop:551 length:408 start_codon:yes stop_codon:yes gene_type:complete
MPIFIVNNETFEMNINDTMLHLKQLVIKKCNLDNEYIDLDIKIDTPIRGFGKMNLVPGILPRTMDNFPFNRYNLEGKTINCNYILVEDYLPNVVKINNDVPQQVYKPPSMQTKSKQEKNLPFFDIYSHTEFPSLK